MNRCNRGSKSLHRTRAGHRQSHPQAEKNNTNRTVTVEGPEAQWWCQSGLCSNNRAPSPRHTDRRGCSQARHSLQADVRGQLEGIFQYVELLDLPRLPSVNGACDLKGPGIPLLSRTGLQEVFCGCSSLQLNKELWEETASQVSTQWQRCLLYGSSNLIRN